MDAYALWMEPEAISLALVIDLEGREDWKVRFHLDAEPGLISLNQATMEVLLEANSGGEVAGHLGLNPEHISKLIRFESRGLGVPELDQNGSLDAGSLTDQQKASFDRIVGAEVEGYVRSDWD